MPEEDRLVGGVYLVQYANWKFISNSKIRIYMGFSALF